jgi:multiple sugar transport system substrate-binding protein
MQNGNSEVVKRKILWVFLLILSLISSGCTGVTEGKATTKTELFGGQSNEFGDVTAPSDFDWKQCDGTILNFICEDNISANILSKEVENFTGVTGIKVNIKRMDFNTLEEKINMEFISKTAQYELIYVDPYKTLNRFSEGLEDLNLYEKDATLPHIVGGVESFQEEQLEVCSYFRDKGKLDAIPFDSTTMILFYRLDIFDRYKEQMEKDLGFDPNPGNGDFTWDQFIEVSKWLNENGKEPEEVHGSLTMAAKHNSIYTAFSTVLGAYGGDYFTNDKVKSLGTDTGAELQSRTEEFNTALKKFKEIVALNPENKEGHTWDEVANLFTEENVAMMINWDENVSAIENSKIAGKVGYSVLPKGTKRSSNIYGGSGIGINSYASSKKKLAAWMFIVWATSPQVQMKSFMEKEGGTLPTRTALIEKIEQEFSEEMPQVSAMIQSQKAEYAYYRPKMKNGYEFENIMITNLYKLIQEDRPVKNITINMKSQWSEQR